MSATAVARTPAPRKSRPGSGSVKEKGDPSPVGGASAGAGPTIQMVKPANLVANLQNARIHSEEQVAQLAASITEFGWTNPVLIDENGCVIAGHGRLLAADKIGINEIPCIVIRGFSEDQKRALTLADNRLAENAAWDFGLLAAELNDLQAASFDMAAIGFSEKELDDLLGRAKEALAPSGFQEFDENIKTEHCCPKCGYEWNGG